MKPVIIENWGDLKEQFGLEDTYMGLKSARQISTQMKKEIEQLKEPPPFYAVRCNTESEAIACFNLKKIVNGSPYYIYNGTAN